MEGLKLMPQVWNLYLFSLPQDLLVIILDFVEGHGCTLTTWFFSLRAMSWCSPESTGKASIWLWMCPVRNILGALKFLVHSRYLPCSFSYEIAESIANTNNTLHHKADVFVFTPAIYFLILNVIHLIYVHFWKSYLSMWQEK